MKAQTILEHLDGCQSIFPFLANDGRMHLADTRLTVFRSPKKWAAFVEIPHYCEGSVEFLNWIGGAGNCLIDGYCTRAEEFSMEPLFGEVEDAPLWKYSEDGEYREEWLGDRAGFSVLVKGERHDFSPRNRDYAAAGIAFDEERTGPDSIEPGCLLRFLCHHLNHPFFTSETELRSLLHDSPELEIFIQTRHWHHPEFLMDSWREDEEITEHHIRNIPCFQILSRAIASGDLTEWNNQDTTPFNTHWERLEAIRNEMF